MAISRLVASLFSASNENTIALANLNFDFTLIKYQVPPEFETLGESLSLKCRQDAEEGPVHQTARRLGALFEQLVPPTPKLTKAYGLRASQIAEVPGVNPRGSRNDGPFEAFVGADGTSLWAAATSEHSNALAHAPLAMHLLACMLARAWDPDKASAIWVEIVDERQKEIDASINTEPQLESACWAARQKISRKQLGAWDASARAWLRSADEARVSDRTKLALILKNLTLPVNETKSTYDIVISVWRNAMVGMEKLVDGMPQQLSDGSVLLALSAWHLFPDLIVLGESTKYVSFADDLIRKGGTITIGLHSDDEIFGEGMHWSLALSHYRYYGDAITVKAEPNDQRVTMEQLLIVVFGAVLSSWGIPSKKEIDAADWLIALRQSLVPTDSSKQKSPSTIPVWLQPILKGAECFLQLEKQDGDTCRMLVSWGRRRGKSFLDLQGSTYLPFFGLCNPVVQVALGASNAVEVGIEYFRAVARELGLESGDTIIRYTQSRQYAVNFEYATAVPHLRSSSKRSAEGATKTEQVHCRWLVNSSKFLSSNRHRGCVCAGRCTEACQCDSLFGMCNDLCHPDEKRHCQVTAIVFEKRANEIRSFGECCQIAPARDFSGGVEVENSARSAPRSLPGRFLWQSPPYLFHTQSPSELLGQDSKCPSLSVELTYSHCTCFESYSRDGRFPHTALFGICAGDSNGFALFTRIKGSGLGEIASIASRIGRIKERCLDPRKGARILKEEDGITRDALRDYLGCLTDPQALPSSNSYGAADGIADGAADGIADGAVDGIADGAANGIANGIASLLHGRRLLKSFFHSLRALQFARSVYEDLVGATISLGVTSFCLNDAKYFQEATKKLLRPEDHHENVLRAHKLSCIALFESGIHNLESGIFESVFAMAYTNSIFVSTELLSDPLDDVFGKYGLRRIIGNIGRPGLSLMVFPQQQARIRPLSNNYRIVPHLQYDSKREDNFGATTLHLSFTDWKRPINDSTRGAHNEDVSLIESFISVHDRGRWVADINAILEMVPQELNTVCKCDGQGDAENLTSIDDWEELLDPPDNIGIFRAQKNWAARLAAAAIREQQEHVGTTLLLRSDSEICAKCLASNFLEETGKGAGMIID